MTLRRILVAAAADGLREALEARLAAQGCDVICVEQPALALRRGSELAPDVVFWGLPGAEAEARALALGRLLPEAVLVLLLPPGAEDRALSGPLGRIAAEVLRLPAGDREVARTLGSARERIRLRMALHRTSRELREGAADRPIVAASPAMIELLEALDRVTGHDAPVLLQGERGTGKEGVARALHAQSPRRDGPFVVLRCAGEDSGWLEAALFGTRPPSHELRRGRFVEADGGTLYLADIDALPAALQRRVLHALRHQEVARERGALPRRIDVRVLGGTTRDLRACTASGDFDDDLLDALGKLVLPVPPLRERREDVPLLVDHLLARARRELGRPIGIADAAMARLLDYPWPGNVRELQNVVERALLRLRGDRITPLELTGDLDPESPSRGDSELDLRRARRQVETRTIREALRRTEGNRTHAARLLGISHRALLYKLKEYGLRDV